MVVAEDLLLVFLFLTIVSYYFKLKQDLLNQRKFFIDTLSHDLSVSTLAQIRGIEILQDKLNLDSESAELLHDINNSCRFTLDMITMLLNTYKYEDSLSHRKMESFNIADIILSTTDKLSNIALDKNIEFAYSLDANIDITGDSDAFYKVMYNLITTTIYNANKNSKIFLKVKKIKQKLLLSITYHGLSITEDEFKNRSFNKPKFSAVGHGIKMHLCKKIIQFHQGKIFVRKFGKDTNTIVFSIPSVKKRKFFRLPIFSKIQPHNY